MLNVYTFTPKLNQNNKYTNRSQSVKSNFQERLKQ